jgi:hypothetical protein
VLPRMDTSRDIRLRLVSHAMLSETSIFSAVLEIFP